MVEQVIYDCTLLEYYEKITDTPILLLSNQQVSTKKYFPNYFPSKEGDEIAMFELKYPDGNFYDYHYLINILESSNGKLSLCGNSILMFMDDEYAPKIIDLYFHSCEESEMVIILEEILKAWKGIFSGDIIRSNNNVKLSTGHNSVMFHTNIYKNQTSILQSIGPSCNKIGWDPTTGYFCTIVTGLILSLHWSLDIHPMNIDNYNEECKPDIANILYNNYLNFRGIKERLNSDIVQVIFHMWLKLLILNAKERLITDSN